VADGRKWLIELVRKGRRHLTHFAEARDVEELVLKLLQAFFARLAFGEIADESREPAAPVRVQLADGEFHGKRCAVLSLPDDDTPDPDDAPLARAQIA